MKICRGTVLMFLALLTVLLAGSCVNKEKNEEPRVKMRARLLEDAMAYLGVCSPEEAVDIWVQGLKEGSAAMQFAVMNPQLKERYKKALEKSAPDWVTGGSSPRISGYSVMDVSETAQGLKLYSLEVLTDTSAGPAQSYLAVLALECDGQYWRIAAMSLDDELAAYTGCLIN